MRAGPAAAFPGRSGAGGWAGGGGMARITLTGSRIRERRLALDIRQAELARRVGVSPAYLNLIEHNRRKIGGKLLIDIAAQLGVDAAQLAEGAQVALLEAMSDAAAAHPEAGAELPAIEEFAGRFPGWAGLIGALHRRNGALEQTVTVLSDRLTHDPQLAASLHEVLSVVTAIRSTSAILTDKAGVDPEWQARFHRNLYEDSRRLAESAQALVAYLDAAEAQAEDDAAQAPALPLEELEAWLAARGYHVAELEGDAALTPEALLADEKTLSRSPTTRVFALHYLESYLADARRVPLAALRRALAETGADPLALAARFDCDLACVLRRLAALPGGAGADGALPGMPEIGLVCCDGSGTLTFRKPIEGFAIPRFGAACPLWPLFQALSRPATPIRMWLEQAGYRPRRYLSYAVAQPLPRADFSVPQTFGATMLILPETALTGDALDGSGGGERGEAGGGSGGAPLGIGVSCRICPRQGCAARREPSILTDGF